MSIFEQEIIEQPQILSSVLKSESENVGHIAAFLRGKFDYIVVAARGSSDNAARYAQYLFGARNHVPISLATPSLYTLYQQPPRLAGALVMGISQSGQSPDIVAVLAAGRLQGRPTLAVTNDPDSPLAKVADHVILLHAGEEHAIAASKTYTASLGALALLSAALTEDVETLKQLESIPTLMEQTISDLSPILRRVERYRYMAHCAVIGRGYNYATAFEAALKIKELSRVVAEPYSSADFRHGPIVMAREGFPILVIAPTGAVTNDLRELIHDLRSRGSELLIISDQRDLLNLAHLSLAIPAGTPEHLSPMIAIVPGQLFSLALAQAKNLDPDRPTGLHKVTETM